MAILKPALVLVLVFMNCIWLGSSASQLRHSYTMYAVNTFRLAALAVFGACLLFLSSNCVGQSVSQLSEPDLSKFSRDQLIACFEHYEICGAADSRATGWQISDELAKRGDPHDLLVRYWTEPKWLTRNGIEHVAYHFDTAEVTEFMKRVVLERVNDGEDRYWAVNYLAKKCDGQALKELSTGRYRDQGSLQYETSVELFGKCGYRPAIPYLVDTAVYDPSLNIVGAADDSLHALFPDAPKGFQSLLEMQRYFCGRAKREGFRIRCR